MNPSDPRSGSLDPGALKLLQKALLATPGDWETRGYLLRHYIAIDDWAQAQACLTSAPTPAASESDILLQAQVEARTAPDVAIATLTALLQRNKACAHAYLQLACIYRERGQKEEARKKYGAATLLDESLADPEWESWLGSPPAPTSPPSSSAAAPHSPAAAPDGSSPPALSPDEIAAAVRDAVAPDGPRVTFADVGGMKDIIERIRMNIIYPFKNPEVFKKFNRKPGGGILLYGPPGCGKTHIARATAGECGATFMSIAITDVLSKWIGESERQLHELFELARRRTPAVLFIDEIDAIGMSRSEAASASAPLTNVLLTELDGIHAANTNLMVLAATNSPWRVDNALRRPGRFDRVVFVPPPDAEARRTILELYLREVPHETADLATLARQTERFSGADLRAVVTRAAEQAITIELKTGRATKVTGKMLQEAIRQMRPSTAEWLDTARSYASYGNRSGAYDDLVEYFEKT